MTSWWTGGLGNITGQITSLAKDVLTEGTEEVDDHETALKIARERIKELESQCVLYKGEYEKSKARLGELHDSLHSAELQLKTTSAELRNVVVQKEAESALAKQKYDELSAVHERLLSERAASAGKHYPQLADGPTGGDYDDDDRPTSHYQRLHAAAGSQHGSTSAVAVLNSYELDDVVLAQQEIDRLRAELQRQQRLVPRQQQQQAKQESDVQLHQQQIADLQAKLKVSADNHQHELVTLQDVHARRLAEVRRAAQQQATDQEGVLASLQAQLDALKGARLPSLTATGTQTEATEGLVNGEPSKSPPAGDQQVEKSGIFLPNLHDGLNSTNASQHLSCNATSVGVQTLEASIATNEETHGEQQGVGSFHSNEQDTSRAQWDSHADSSLLGSIAHLEAQVASLQAEKEQLQSQLDAAVGADSRAESSAHDLSTSEQSLTCKHLHGNDELASSLQEENDSLRLSLDELDRQHEEATASLVLIRDELTQHNRHLTSQLQEKQSALEIAIAKQQGLEQVCADLERECADLTSRLGTMEERADNGGDRLDQLQAANLDLQQAVNELEAKVAELNGRLGAAAGVESRLSDRCRSLEALASSAEAAHADSLAALRADVALHQATCSAWARSAAKLASSLLPGGDEAAVGGEAVLGPADLEELCTRAGALVAANCRLEGELAATRQSEPLTEEVVVAVAASSSCANRPLTPDESADDAGATSPASDASPAGSARWLEQLDRLARHVSADLAAARVVLLAAVDGSERHLSALPCLRPLLPLPEDAEPGRDAAAGDITGGSSLGRANGSVSLPSTKTTTTTVAGCEPCIADADRMHAAPEDDTERQMKADVAALASAVAQAVERLTEQQVDLLEQLTAAARTAQSAAASAAARHQHEAEQSERARELLAQREAGLERLRSELAARDGSVLRLQEEAAELELRLADAADELAQAGERLRSLGAERDALLLQQQQQQLTALAATDVDEPEAVLPAGEDGRGSRHGPSPGRRHGAAAARPRSYEDDGNGGDEDGDSRDAVSDEIKEMRKIIGEKDRVIGELRSTNGGLLRLLDGDHSAAAAALAAASAQGERTHELDERLRAVQAELQRTADLLSSVTLENRSLRAELSSSQAAPATGAAAAASVAGWRAQLQSASSGPTMPVMSPRDYDDGGGSSDHVGGDDDEKRDNMSREAVRKLANIIRDKDLEIEALKQKSATLLAVLQEAGSGSGAAGTAAEQEEARARLAAALEERDSLATQVGLYQADREQLYTALRHKHDEATVYFAEAHRLQAAAAGALSERDAVRQELAQLAARLDERQRELAAVGSELRDAKLKLFDALAAAAAAGGAGGSAGSSSSDAAADLQPRSSKADGIDGSGENDAAGVVGSEGSGATVELSAFDAKCQEVTTLKEKVRNQREAHLEKDRLVAELSGKVRQLETAGVVKEQEAAQLHQQLNRVRFELDSCRAELEELRGEMRQLSQRAGAHDSEAELLQEHNRKLLLLIREKESALRHAQERADSLEKLLQEKQRGASAAAAAEESGLLAMCEAARRQALEAGQERDQAMLALQQRQAECQQLAAEVQACRAREKKVATEAERLRAHLLRVEEGYTREALEAEEREKDLRNRLLAAEEKAFSSSAVVQAANADNLKKVESLYEQLHVMASQRDNAMMQLASAQEQAHQYGQQLSNLQMVLEQFQRERDAWHAAEIDKLHRQLDEKVRELLAAKSSLADLQNRAVEQAEALEAAARLSQQLDRKEEALAAMRQEVQMREQSLCEAEEKVTHLTQVNESRVDKQVIKSLMLGYLGVANNKRSDVLRLIAGVLEFSHEESAKAGLSEGTPASAVIGSWLPLSGFWRRSGSSGMSSPASTPTKARNADGSFSELFVKFLETESSPAPPQARLPVDRMIEEERRRHEASRQMSAATVTNPFRLPPVTGLASVKSGGGGGGGSSHTSSLLVADLPLARGFAGHALVAPDAPLLLSGSPVPALVMPTPTAAAVVPASRHTQMPSDNGMASSRLTPVTAR